MTSACAHSPSTTGRRKRARQASGRFSPVAMPSLALIDWMSIAMRFAMTMTHSSR